MPSFRSPRRRPRAEAPRQPPGLDATRNHGPARAVVDCGVYVDGTRLPSNYTYAAALAKVRELRLGGNEAFAWIGLHEPDLHQMQTVAEVFGLHPLAVEDAVHAHQRPKLERYDEILFLVLKTVNYVEHESIAAARAIVESGEIMIFAGRDFVVTVRHGEHGGLAGVRKQMDASPAILKLGPYAVVHAIADHVVDSYLDVTDLIKTDIDSMEQNTFSPRTLTAIEHIYLLKREVVELRRAVSPLTLALQWMTADDNDLISVEVRRYMGDVLGHNVQAADRIAGYDEMLRSLLEVAYGKVGNQQNVDMRKISAWAGIVSVPTVVSAIFAMRFTHIPELQWTWSYLAAVALMATVCVALYRNLRHNRWL
jgi:magnesium transporter